ncbi:thiolase family protein [Telmatocola sphagniphila]|uniref:Thiolase family protein n=1 Tax=Telmatocola sphagniphila TaxID=1123043 RepID=A0A8E6B6Y1_9BACT|nr:thiolase family protein [Telmatocola sphagniphila]QVL33013.1 thiolase family protein [Telmatocola sphagniphila]
MTVILSAVRTPIGKFLGGLSPLTAPQLGALVIQYFQLVPDQVIMGNVVQAGVGQNPSRQAALGAELPTTMDAHTVNMVCGSGLKAVMLADVSIRSGEAECIIAGGMESMSNAPHLLRGRTGFKYGDAQLTDALIHDGLYCPFEHWPMGNAAEHIAKKFGITRKDQDEFSVHSHLRAAAAWEQGFFNEEVLPVEVQSGKTTLRIDRDEGIRADSSVEALARLKPAFAKDGTVTAGNASQLSDGAAALVIASEVYAQKQGQKPLAKIRSQATSGVDPKDIFIAPVEAIQRAIAKAGLKLEDIDYFEINEAFAAQMLACCRELKLDPEKVNVQGGGVALGHPIGASGARVLTSLIHTLKRTGKKFGCASLCLGGGNAVAVIVENLA